jgi:hypothetical protein
VTAVVDLSSTERQPRALTDAPDGSVELAELVRRKPDVSRNKSQKWPKRL